MRFDPDRHRRRSVRLKGYDYAELGAYFVTVCTRDRACLFGHVVNGDMHLNEAGETAQRCWEDIPHHFPHAALDAMAIISSSPNHHRHPPVRAKHASLFTCPRQRGNRMLRPYGNVRTALAEMTRTTLCC